MSLSRSEMCDRAWQKKGVQLCVTSIVNGNDDLFCDPTYLMHTDFQGVWLSLSGRISPSGWDKTKLQHPNRFFMESAVSMERMTFIWVRQCCGDVARPTNQSWRRPRRSGTCLFAASVGFQSYRSRLTWLPWSSFALFGISVFKLNLA